MSKFSYDIALLRNYVNGELSPREMHEIERASHEDEMLMDILIGLEIEKKRNSDNPIGEIQKKLESRTAPQETQRRWFYNRSLQIAASIIVILSTIGLLYWSKHTENSETKNSIARTDTSTPNTKREIESAEKPLLKDSVGQLANETKVRKLPSATEHLYGPTSSSHSNDRTLTNHEKQILAYTPVQKNIEISKDITDPLNVSHPKYENDVIVVNTDANESKSNLIASNSRKTLQSKVGGIGVSNNPNMQPSAAQMRARLNSMGLDPQTSFILGQVIDQQSREPITGVQVKDLQTNKIVVTDEDGRFSYAANNKKNLEINAIGYQSKEIAAENGEQTILLTPDDNALEEVTVNSVSKITRSSPSIGWSKYNKQLQDDIRKLTNVTYEFKIRMELDRKGNPVRIVFLKSSDSSLNSKIIQLIENGPRWQRGSDWKNVYLQFKSE